MKRSLAIRRYSLISLLLALLLSPLAAFAADTRSCSIKEIIKGGMYVYLRCEEKGSDIWLASVARTFREGEVITFINAPPMINFYSKQLDRTFPEVIFTDILPPGDKGKSPAGGDARPEGK